MTAGSTVNAGTIVSSRWRGSQLTVQGWQNLVLSIMGVVVLAGAVAGAVLLNRTDEVSRELSDDIQPARLAAYQLQAALRDQETALRGYVIAADRQFLDPYYDGERAEGAAAQDIRQRVGGRAGLIADLDAIERAAAAWRTSYAEPLIASVTPGVPNVVSRATADRGKAEFDHLRTLFDTQNAHLAAARADGIHERDEVRGWRDRILAAMVGVFFATAILLAVLVRSAVTRPLAALAAACRRITEGNFAENISPLGPKDVRAIATDVENMRQRIVDELDASRWARAGLVEQAEALDEQAAELRRSNAELEQFAYVASHDLQEPLRKVASFCQLLEKRYGDKLDERGREYVGFAVDGAKRMQVLINDLLTFSRVGRLNAMRTEVDLDTALDAALANLATAIEESGAQIVRPRRQLPPIIGDPTLLAMLWQNLIGNAVKFRRDDRAPRIVIDCERGSGDRDGEWLLSVADNGIGIAEEFVDKVFVIFQRLHGRDAYTGTGIGLALCKKIVEYHGGTIWIDTSYTDGTRFRFTMPIAVDERRAAILEGAQK
ncbi:MAG TPA: CHASE3 domain-containing protein [Mycobacterium sp.]|uniref:sensor histidine kinase n=1 Tax=Mycobacterium sp. TaxID=1785 RepID=UPI002C456F99|nr:CHASE3 domain-containing protein [Mycobacterium sp.]HME76239.1 CHASE3 domain-containing protein [Mycobacterium sp.]